MSITPDIITHQTLESEATEYLNKNGYLVDAATYHTKMRREIVERLQRTYNPTSLYLRGRADRIAIHKIYPVAFEWEAKTHTSEVYHDMTLEALPLCHHISKARLGVECLYIYQDNYPRHEHEVGFWVTQLPPIREIKIPNRWDSATINWYRVMFGLFLPGVRVVEMGRGGGSGDPFIIIDESVVCNLKSWQELALEPLRRLLA